MATVKEKMEQLGEKSGIVMTKDQHIEQLEARIELALACIQTGQSHACDLCKSYFDEAEQALGKDK